MEIILNKVSCSSVNEERKLNSMGFKSITLGNRIMRVETVPIFILSVLNYETME